MLLNLYKLESQSMDDYLHQIKSVAGSLPAIESPVSDLELIHALLMVLIL